MQVVKVKWAVPYDTSFPYELARCLVGIAFKGYDSILVHRPLLGMQEKQPINGFRYATHPFIATTSEEVNNLLTETTNPVE